MECNLRQTLCVLTLFVASAFSAGPNTHYEPHIAFTQTFGIDTSTLQVDFADGPLDLPRTAITERIQWAAHAVALYYGHFPVPRARILILPVANGDRVLQGTTWGARDGFPAFLRLRIGQSITREGLTTDWIITHELVHTALPSLPDDQHWLEEGLASYVEPIARVQAGEMSPESIWADMLRGMIHGEPEQGDRGLNNTHTWGRTYWGGALFCLVADIEIHRQTHNRLGLQDALRAIVRSGGTIDKEWPTARVLKTGDTATGTHVLEQMYARWSSAPVPVDLPKLWRQLGVRSANGIISFDSSAPDAAIRTAITQPRTATP
ncbi:hypothetical protein [Terriglobus saanensis]|uniref:Peptidase MA-like domain-containing protein n=1 Tax=Terriglobus saanensis (strain ATCC BAA-1853 / DSM 23119 / SP1PR4) TaxID=401053 RepID=E8UX82_TERSS|nr:hypothetical protein [Terriglobus saanensis]ADV83045.1 hypothetical protein AciPR4_2243 [Terriglobus saanensis SP1PR4]